LEAKTVELEGFIVADNDKVQVAYYQGQMDYIASRRPKVQQNLQVYFAKG